MRKAHGWFRASLPMVAIASALVSVLATQPAAAEPSDACVAGQLHCMREEISALLRCSQRCRSRPALCGTAEELCSERATARLGTARSGGDGCLDRLAARGLCGSAIGAGAIDAHAKDVVAHTIALTEGRRLAQCGNGIIEPGEECE